MNEFDKADIWFTCPDCRRDFKVKAGEMKKGRSLKCPNCGTEFIMEDEGPSELAKKTIEKHQKNFKRKFKS